MSNLNGWTRIQTPGALETALSVARGCYQRNLLRGVESLSGSTLRGVAASYGYHYARSRKNLLARVRAVGVDVSEERGERGKRILVLG
jgi:hypothetical protein